MVRGQGKVVVTVTTKTSADQVYLASKRVFTINLTGKVQNSDWVFKQDSDGKVILMKYTGKAVNVTVPTTDHDRNENGSGKRTWGQCF